MKLSAVENFALRMLYRTTDEMSIKILEQIDTAIVVQRKINEVGFFTTIRLKYPLKNIIYRQRDWNFAHDKLIHGGSFICWIEDDDIIELEAVVHSGMWPECFDPDDFKEST